MRIGVKRSAIALTVAIGLAAASPLVKREAVTPLEASIKDHLVSRQMEILALPRGLYIEGVGVVFTADVSLVYAPIINPFQLTISPEVRQRNHEKKLLQLPVLRQDMKQIIMDASVALETMPFKEEVILGVTIGHQTWENTAGIPSQIVMRGERGKLLEAKLGRIAPDVSIRIQEQ